MSDFTPSLERADADLRSHIMGHARASIFDRYYRNCIVQLDTQSAVLGVTSRDALIKLGGHMSLTRDPSAPSKVPRDQSAVDSDPEVQALVKERTRLRGDLISRFGMIRPREGAEELHREMYGVYQRLLRSLTAAKKIVDRRVSEGTREEFFRTAGTKYIDEERRGVVQQYVEPTPVFDFEERAELAGLLFPKVTHPHHPRPNADLTERSEDEIYEKRIAVMRTMVSLCSRRMPRPQPHSRPRTLDPSLKAIKDEESEGEDEDPDTFPTLCPSTVCLFCLGDDSLSSTSRTFAFRRKAYLQKHVQEQHLRGKDWKKELECPHPHCEVELESDMHFKNHSANVHNVWM